MSLERHRPARPHRLLPLGEETANGTDEMAARVAAQLLHRAPGEPVRTLEAVAAAEVNRLRRWDASRRPQGSPVSSATSARYALCLRIARRAVAGTLATDVGMATRYHRDGAAPAWAKERKPVTEVGGFVFYAT